MYCICKFCMYVQMKILELKFDKNIYFDCDKFFVLKRNK